MTTRITEKMLGQLAGRINTATGSPATSYTRNAVGGMWANIGNYHISYAYGGACLHRMSSTGGGVCTPLGAGHVTKRELWEQMHAYLAGLEAKQA